MGALAEVRLHLVDSLAVLDECRRWAGERREGPLCADTESGGLSPYHHRLRLVQLGDLRHGWAFPGGWWGAAVEILQNYPGSLAMHNSPYDNRVLARHTGYVPQWHKTDDTLLAGHLCDSLKLAGLKPRSATEIDPTAMRGEAVLQEGMQRQHWTWDTVPYRFEPYWCYAALDPVLTAHLWAKFGPQVRTQFRAAYDLERATARICANMMDAGMMTDVPYITGKIADIRQYTAQAFTWLKAEFGIGSVRSNEQVGRALNEAGIPTLMWTDGGKPSISKDALKFYGIRFPEHKHLIDAIRWCRKGDDLIGKYLQKFLELRLADDVMHYSIWSCRARTSRMSITDPPMQTFDRDEPAVRGGFIPRPGNVLISIDADQIEARLAAHFSRDPRMIQDFIDADAQHLKFFIEMASKIYSERITKKDPRYTWTKNATYAQIYGSGLEQAAKTAGVPVEIMRPSYMGFRELYPGVYALMNRLIKDGKRTRRPEVRTLSGRRLYAHKGHEYALLNYKIQGSAAEIMKNGAVQLDAAGLGHMLRLPVHDEFLLEAPKEYAQDVLAEAERILTDTQNFAMHITWSGSILEDRWVKT